MEETYYGFKMGPLLIGMLKMLKNKGVLNEQEILDLLWDVKEPMFPWTREEIKELLKL